MQILHSVPVQVVPSPVKPGLHAHVKLPGMLLQAALMSQLSVFKVHSSSSDNMSCKDAAFTVPSKHYVAQYIQIMSLLF